MQDEWSYVKLDKSVYELDKFMAPNTRTLEKPFQNRPVDRVQEALNRYDQESKSSRKPGESSKRRRHRHLSNEQGQEQSDNAVAAAIVATGLDEPPDIASEYVASTFSLPLGKAFKDDDDRYSIVPRTASDAGTDLESLKSLTPDDSASSIGKGDLGSVYQQERDENGNITYQPMFYGGYQERLDENNRVFCEFEITENKKASGSRRKVFRTEAEARAYRIAKNKQFDEAIQQVADPEGYRKKKLREKYAKFERRFEKIEHRQAVLLGSYFYITLGSVRKQLEKTYNHLSRGNPEFKYHVDDIEDVFDLLKQYYNGWELRQEIDKFNEDENRKEKEITDDTLNEKETEIAEKNLSALCEKLEIFFNGDKEESAEKDLDFIAQERRELTGREVNERRKSSSRLNHVRTAIEKIIKTLDSIKRDRPEHCDESFEEGIYQPIKVMEKWVRTIRGDHESPQPYMHSGETGHSRSNDHVLGSSTVNISKDSDTAHLAERHDESSLISTTSESDTSCDAPETEMSHPQNDSEAAEQNHIVTPRARSMDRTDLSDQNLERGPRRRKRQDRNSGSSQDFESADSLSIRKEILEKIRQIYKVLIKPISEGNDNFKIKFDAFLSFLYKQSILIRKRY